MVGLVLSGSDTTGSYYLKSTMPGLALLHKEPMCTLSRLCLDPCNQTSQRDHSYYFSISTTHFSYLMSLRLKSSWLDDTFRRPHEDLTFRLCSLCPSFSLTLLSYLSNTLLIRCNHLHKIPSVGMLAPGPTQVCPSPLILCNRINLLCLLGQLSSIKNTLENKEPEHLENNQMCILFEQLNTSAIASIVH